VATIEGGQDGSVFFLIFLKTLFLSGKRGFSCFAGSKKRDYGDIYKADFSGIYFCCNSLQDKDLILD